MNIRAIEESLDAACQALTHLCRGLESAAFAEAADAYDHMVNVILAQRIVTSSELHPELEERFETIAATAAEIRTLLSPWIPMMDRLVAMRSSTYEVSSAMGAAFAVVADVEPTDDQGGETVAARSAILAWLRSHPGAQPLSRISASLALPSEAIDVALGELAARGTVRERTSGRRKRWEAVVQP